MPCNSDYLAANGREIELSRVACLLDELEGRKFSKSDWAGYHPKVYNQNPNGDAMVAKLCTALQTADVSKYSLEMQMWWRDHQKADKQRIAQEVKTAKSEAARKAALAKLTPHERKLLGF